MRWLRYALLLWFYLALIAACFQTFLIWNVMTPNTVRETLVEVIPALLAILYIWRNPPRSRVRVVDQIGVLKEEIKLQPPVQREPGDNVMAAAERLKHVASPPLFEVKHGPAFR